MFRSTGQLINQSGLIKENDWKTINKTLRANGRAHPQPGLLLIIIEPKPIKGGTVKNADVAGCRVERGLGCNFIVQT